MTQQYKNPFEDPEEKLWDQKIKDFKIPKRKKTPLEEKAEEIPGYIYVPTIKLYVAKEKSLRGLSWEDTHKELHKQGLQMLTIRQFIDFMFYLEKNSSIQDATKIMDEILTTSTRDPWRGEWLDARFSKEERHFFHPSRPYTTLKKVEGLYISYNHRTKNDGGLVAQNVEPLEECLMKDCNIDLRSCNKQGLPTKEYSGESRRYFPPREGCVAGFSADSYKAYLCCGWTVGEEPPLGVRAAFKKESKKVK